MENASKALLIAGAVLIVIVLISVGMLIVQQASSTVDEAGNYSSKQAVETFNTQFTQYAGSQKGSSIKTLLSSIATSNATNESGHIITVKFDTDSTGKTSASDINAIVSSVVNSKTYTVTISETGTDGYISGITIK